MGIADSAAHEQFFYLRISGLPYYIFATINPSSSSYGASAWSAPTDYPATWAQRGLHLPDDEIEQKFPDIIGGVASAGRLRLSVIDFPDPSRPSFGFFSRLFAPGRAMSDSSVVKAPVTATVHADSTSITVQSAAATFAASSDVFLGNETIGIGAVTGPDGDGVSTLAIVDRNKYACFGNTADDPDACFPPIPYHRIAVDPTGAQSAGALVSSDVSVILGRHAALWMGIMGADGNPEAPSSSKCLLLGRITNLDVGDGGTFDITVESITADLKGGLVAPDLVASNIASGIYITNSEWLKFELTFYFSGFLYAGPDLCVTTISVAAGVYTPQSLADAVNAALQAVDMGDDGFNTLYHGTTLYIAYNETGPHFAFRIVADDIGLIANATTIEPAIGRNNEPDRPDFPASLLTVLGFKLDEKEVTIPGSAKIFDTTRTWKILADRPVPEVFVPTIVFDNQGTGDNPVFSEDVVLTDDVAGDFFTDQLDGTDRAFVRLGDGQIVPILSTDAGTRTITIGEQFSAPGIEGVSDLPGFYYVDSGGTGTVEQIVLTGESPTTSGRHGAFLAKLVASTTGQTRDDINVFPEGVGLGWRALMDDGEWLLEFESGVTRVALVDRAMTFMDLFGPVSREHGLFICWDPDDSLVRLRTMRVPQAANADSFTFDESNRSSPGDRTTQRLDLTSLRTSWRLRTGFEWISQQFKIGPIVLNDVQSRSNYPNNARQETIEDKTIVYGSQVGPFLVQRFALYGIAWTLCTRSLNKRGMLMAPGTIHHIVDATAVNPFTGASQITSGDAVYGLLTSVSANPATGEVKIQFMINSGDDNARYRPWSPSGLIDFANNSGGYTNGYNSSTKTLAMLAHYGQANDALDFVAGDKVRVAPRDRPITTEYLDTVASVGATTIVLTTGLSGPVSTSTDSVVMLQPYSEATTDRKTGDHKVSFMGDGKTRIIDGVTSAYLHRWGA